MCHRRFLAKGIADNTLFCVVLNHGVVWITVRSHAFRLPAKCGNDPLRNPNTKSHMNLCALDRLLPRAESPDGTFTNHLKKKTGDANYGLGSLWLASFFVTRKLHMISFAFRS